MIDRRLRHVESRLPGMPWQVKDPMAAAVLGNYLIAATPLWDFVIVDDCEEHSRLTT